MKKKLEKIEESNGQKKKEGEKADKDQGMKQWFKKKILQQE